VIGKDISMKLDAFQLKIIAIGLMLLDHIYHLLPNNPVWFTWLGRIVAPIFFFLVVEGFFHTRDRRKYITRLLLWALVMFVGSRLVFTLLPYRAPLNNNIFLSLGLGLVLLSAIEWTAKTLQGTRERLSGTLLITATVLLSTFTEASVIGVALVLIFYFYRQNRFMLSVSYFGLCCLFFLAVAGDLTKLPIGSWDGMHAQWLMVLALPFILLYSGQRGHNSQFMKHFFYLFYPLHLWVLYILGFYLGKA